jgi:hypothetical protein
VFADNVVSGDIGWYLGNIVRGLIDPSRGLLVWSPFLLVLAPGLPSAWRAAPSWARGPAIGAVLYLLIQWKANLYAGGGGFSGYRYPLEALMAAGPLLYLAAREWVADRKVARRLFELTAAGAVTLQVVAALS